MFITLKFWLHQFAHATGWNRGHWHRWNDYYGTPWKERRCFHCNWTDERQPDYGTSKNAKLPKGGSGTAPPRKEAF